MDWLSGNGAQIDCERKKIKVRAPDKKDIAFKGHWQNQEIFDHGPHQTIVKKGKQNLSNLCNEYQKGIP